PGCGSGWRWGSSAWAARQPVRCTTAAGPRSRPTGGWTGTYDENEPLAPRPLAPPLPGVAGPEPAVAAGGARLSRGLRPQPAAVPCRPAILRRPAGGRPARRRRRRTG